MNVVRAAITQTTWTGDQASMLDKHEGFARSAAAQGAQVICFQELFTGPTSASSRTPSTTTTRNPSPARPCSGSGARRRAGHGHGAADLRGGEPGVYYNTAVVVDADGTSARQVPQEPHPEPRSFWEKFYFRPGNLGYPVFDTAVGTIGVYICYDRHFPEGWRELALNGAQIVFNPNATKPGLSNRLWDLEQAAAAAARTSTSSAPNRVGSESNEFGDKAVTFYGTSQFVDPRGNFVGDRGSTSEEDS